jgi:hypothetical protein
MFGETKGHLLSFGDFPHKQVLKWHRKYGPIINIKMGVQNWICIGDRMLAHELFVQNGSIFLAGFDALFSKLHSHGGR